MVFSAGSIAIQFEIDHNVSIYETVFALIFGIIKYGITHCQEFCFYGLPRLDNKLSRFIGQRDLGAVRIIVQNDQRHVLYVDSRVDHIHTILNIRIFPAGQPLQAVFPSYISIFTAIIRYKNGYVITVIRQFVIDVITFLRYLHS